MKPIKFGKITISDNKPVVIIAEVACEHKGDMRSAKRLIRATKKSGADIVKFQLHVPEAEMVPNSIKFWAGPMDDVLKKVNFGKLEQHKELKQYCKELDIQYLCTPFCMEASDILEQAGVDAYKIGSGELTNLPMLRHIARKKKPMIVSTGMSTMNEIRDAVTVLKNERANFMLTHCLSEYPADYENMNLGLIPELRKKFGLMIGLSDHSREIYSALAAVALGANLIEKHFTIRDLHGPDDIVSLDPEEFKNMVSAIRKIEMALGTKKQISKRERVVRDWAHHSVVAAREIKSGEKLSLKNLAPKRPGRGIEAKYLDALYSKKLLGRKAKHSLIQNTILQWHDIE